MSSPMSMTFWPNYPTLTMGIVGECQRCYYFNHQFHQCRRRSPLAGREDNGGNAQPLWPRVGKTDWCGDYAPDYTV